MIIGAMLDVVSCKFPRSGMQNESLAERNDLQCLNVGQIVGLVSLMKFCDLISRKCEDMGPNTQGHSQAIS
jgi:hypothetical protein